MKKCQDGKEVNSKGRCVKKCEQGKTRNPVTGRCTIDSEIAQCKKKLMDAEKQTKADIRMMKDISSKMTFYKSQMERYEDRLRACNKAKDSLMTEMKKLKKKKALSK